MRSRCRWVRVRRRGSSAGGQRLIKLPHPRNNCQSTFRHCSCAVFFRGTLRITAIADSEYDASRTVVRRSRTAPPIDRHRDSPPAIPVKPGAFGGFLAKAFAGEVQAVGVVHEPIENGVGHRFFMRRLLDGKHATIAARVGENYFLTTWPRISPPLLASVCTLIYHLPAANSAACASVNVAEPSMGLVMPAMGTTTPALFPCSAGP